MQWIRLQTLFNFKQRSNSNSKESELLKRRLLTNLMTNYNLYGLLKLLIKPNNNHLAKKWSKHLYSIRSCTTKIHFKLFFPSLTWSNLSLQSSMWQSSPRSVIFVKPSSNSQVTAHSWQSSITWLPVARPQRKYVHQRSCWLKTASTAKMATIH